MDLAHADLHELIPGTVQALAGQCAMDYIRAAVELIASAGRCHGYRSDQQRIFAGRGGSPYRPHRDLGRPDRTYNPLTLFETHGLRVFFLSRHVSLRQACDLVTSRARA